MVEVPQDMIGLEVASRQLDQMIATDAATVRAGAAAAEREQSANAPAATEQPDPGQRAAQTGEDQPPKPSSTSSSDTPAATEPAAKDQQQQQHQQKTTDQQAKEPTKYEKARARQENAWKQINAEKEALRNAQDDLKRQREEFTVQQQAEANKFTPEQYEKAAVQFDKEGKFDLAEMAKARAAELRKNPPPTPQQAVIQRQQQERYQAEMKEWWGKAAVDFPDVAKQGAPAANALRVFLQKEPDAIRSPKGMYYAARLVTAETAAARVPDMEKELGALRAKVKELEAQTAPTPPSIPQRLGEATKSEAEQFAELEEAAMAMGPLIR